MCVWKGGGGGGGLLGIFGGAVWLTYSLNPDHSLDQNMEFSRTLFQSLVS